MKSKEKIWIESVIIMGISIVYSMILMVIIVAVLTMFQRPLTEHNDIILLMLTGTISAYLGITWNEKTYSKKTNQKGRKKY